MRWHQILALSAALIGPPAGAVEGDHGPPAPDAVALVRDTQVFFPKSSDHLRSAEVAKIEQLATALGRLPGQTLHIHGLTDSRGDPTFNTRLRHERSGAVFARLLELGIDVNGMRISTPREAAAGTGPSPPQMRRVEFSLPGISLDAAPSLSPDAEGDVGEAAQSDGVEATTDTSHGPPDPGALAVTRDTQVFFPKSSANLGSAEIAKIEKLAAALERLPGQTLVIRAMTDPYGNPTFNNWLREERSEAVYQQLLGHGIAAGRLRLAPPRAVATGARKQPSQQLRRVEFAIEGLSLDGAGDSVEHAQKGAPEEGSRIAAAAAAVPPAPPRFVDIGRRDRGRLADVITVADATQVYFEFTGFRVKADYHRELWSLASAILETEDGAVAIRGFASPNLSAAERDRLANRRCLSVAATLQQMGVEWRRIRIENVPGEFEANAPPSWRNHRVEFVAIKALARGGDGSGQGSDEGGELDSATDAEIQATVAGSDDPLAALVADAVIYFGGNSASVRLNDKKKLQRIAEYATKDGETRIIAVRAVTDRWGNQDYNRILGHRRQSAVIRELTTSGLPEERAVVDEIQTTPGGEAGPSWKQRRAELVLRERLPAGAP